ncbi:MAG: low-complexity protein [Gammaproteobacteria bacterium]|nr:hypothetical protein [Gammaproteobacteria bacterium]MYC26257.1 low-complexity protein [Gammaproteobacteria bacterium]
MQINESKPAIVGVGAFMAASLGVALSASLDEEANNLFVAESLDDIDVLSAEDDEEAKCGEGQCGEDDDADDEGDDEGECGEDEGGCGEGQCGEEDDADEDEDADEEEEESTEE